MIEEVGRVVAIDQQGQRQIVWVETEIKTTCNACQMQQGCGTSVVAKAFAGKTQRLRFETERQLELGQQINIGIPEERLLGASALVYLLPIMALIAGALLTDYILPAVQQAQELWVISGAMISASLAFWGVKHYMQKATQQAFCPQILQDAAQNQPTIPVKQL